MHKKMLAAITLLTILPACAGRDARPVAISQPQDPGMTCPMIHAEIAQNNDRIKDLNSEGNGKVAQNVAAGAAGLLIWPLWFAMDFKGAAATDKRAVEERNRYLESTSATKCESTSQSAN